MESVIKHSKEVNDFLTKKLEGKVFVHIYMLKIGRNYSFTKQYYTVKEGEVYIIEKDGTLYPSKDTLFSVEYECTPVGVYDSKKKYERVIKDYSYSEVKNILKLSRNTKKNDSSY